MYLTIILTEEQSISRQVHEDDEMAHPEKSDFIKDQTSQLYAPDCPNCHHSYYMHPQHRTNGSVCSEVEEAAPATTTNSRTNETFILLNSTHCGCILSQADIKANVRLIATNKRLAEQAEAERKARSSEYEAQQAAIRLAQLRDMEIGHQPYYDCCELHNREYNGPGRVNACRIQFRVNASGQVEHIFEQPNKAPEPKDQVGYYDSGYCDGV